MFRKGGNVGEGIMTGIVDRSNHAIDGGPVMNDSADKTPVDFEQQYIDKITAAGAGNQGMDPLTAYLLAAGPAISSGTSFSDAVGKLADPNKQLIELMNKRAEDKRNLKVGAAQFGLEQTNKRDIAGIQQRGALDIRIGKLDELYDIKRKNAAGDKILLEKIEKDYQRDFRDAVQGLDESDLYGVLKNTVVQEALMDNARSYVENNMKIDPNDPKYGATVSAVLAKLSKKYISDLRSNNANGGRIGYANGTPPTMNQGMNQTPVNVGSQEVSDPKVEITYEELRARLPEEINNEVVQMLSTSYEALADFAELRTQADVDTFNSKYGVTLVLPQEA